MGSILDQFKKKAGDAVPLLHGSDLPAKVSSVVIKVKDVREAPDNFASIAIIDLDGEVYGKGAWAVNKTNMRAIMEKYGIDEDAEFSAVASKFRGKKLTLSKVMVNDPKQKKMVPSLFIS
jgi:hypothetical protein